MGCDALFFIIWRRVGKYNLFLQIQEDNMEKCRITTLIFETWLFQEERSGNT
jgi:CCR4-NOT transcriptional regulation complex NOT5 subunit